MDKRYNPGCVALHAFARAESICRYEGEVDVIEYAYEGSDLDTFDQVRITRNYGDEAARNLRMRHTTSGGERILQEWIGCIHVWARLKVRAVAWMRLKFSRRLTLCLHD